ncbi:MAG: ABC transporter ATP-binding protein [Pyrinomonadaceae bacterium]
MTLKIKNLSKKYDDNWIVRDISLEIPRGEILGLFGATGAGKSTLMRVISGLEKAHEGTISFESIELTDKPCEEKGFLFPNVTNQSFWKETFNTQQASQLADGIGQSLALDDALKNAQTVLLLDNQFCYMDRKIRDLKARAIRQTIKEKNLSVIFSTNDYEEIFLVCNRVAVLDGGSVVQIGTPREVYQNPVSAVVADYTGRSNLFRAKRLSSSKTDTPEFLTLEGDHRLFTGKAGECSLGAVDEEALLLIRPEHISISFGASFPEDNLLKAEITQINYQGATTLIQLEANGLILEALVLRLVGLNVGDKCVVGLPPDRIRVFKE